MIPVVVRCRPPRGDHTCPLPRHRPAHEAPTLPIRTDRRIPIHRVLHAGGGAGLAVVASAALLLIAVTVYALIRVVAG